MARTKLTPREQVFIAEYLGLGNQGNRGNGAAAATAAGYSAKSAKFAAFDLLRRPLVAEEIAKKTAKVLSKLDVSVERVLKERARLAFFDARKLFDAEGNAIPVHALDDDTAAAVAGLEIEEAYVGRGKSRRLASRTKKVKISDKAASLAALEKHLGMYHDDGDGTGSLFIQIHL